MKKACGYTLSHQYQYWYSLMATWRQLFRRRNTARQMAAAAASPAAATLAEIPAAGGSSVAPATAW